MSDVTREKQKSLFLHEAVVEKLRKDPDTVIKIGLENIEFFISFHNPDGMAVKYFLDWRNILESGDVDYIIKMTLGTDELSCDLRQNTPFPGVLSQDERVTLLANFRELYESEMNK